VVVVVEDMDIVGVGVVFVVSSSSFLVLFIGGTWMVMIETHKPCRCCDRHTCTTDSVSVMFCLFGGRL